MKTITSTTLGRKPRSVLAASSDAPVFITTRGVETHVLISAQDYERLSGQKAPRQNDKSA